MDVGPAVPAAGGVTRGSVAHAFFGVLLPVAALAVELLTRVSGEIYFDPIPTWWHVLLIACVPLVNAHAAWVTGAGRADHARLSLRLLGVALAISCFYTLLYLPILPFALLGIPVYGLGLLPYAPLCAALAAWRVRRRIVAAFPEAVAPARASLAAASAIALLVALDVPGAVAQVGFAWAASSDSSQRQRGIVLLRSVASDTSLRRVVHDGRSRASLLGRLFVGRGWLRDAYSSGLDRTADARTYYRVTGISPRDTERPATPGADARFFGTPDRSVSRVRDGLALRTSKLDGSVMPDAELAYLEWTLELENQRSFSQAGHAHVLLPPDAAVTRATLWVEGLPRDAAFGPRGAVIQAYERVTMKQRDPLLVTSAGRDRVEIRCFPVPPQGTMKIRLGITAPLVLEAERGELRLPQLVAPNFAVDAALEREVRIDTGVAFTRVPAGLTSRAQGDGFTLLGALPEAEPAWLALPRSDAFEVWSADAVSPNGVAIGQRVEPGPPPIERLVAVVDGSRDMGVHARAISQALGRLPRSIELGIVIASDAPVTLLTPGDPRDAALYLLQHFDFAGGHDDAPALQVGLDLAEGVPRGALLWLHPPLPIALGEAPAASLRRRLEGRPLRTRWLDLQSTPGPDALLAALQDVAPLEPVPRRGGFEQDLDAALARLTGAVPTFTTVRRRRTPPANVGVAPPGSARSAHVSRLWARDEVFALLRSGDESASAEAAALATRYRVVTPVSGAVVLERDVQYAENDLDAPASGADAALAKGLGGDFDPIAGAFPAVPEPGTGLLTAFGLTLLAAWRRRTAGR